MIEIRGLKEHILGEVLTEEERRIGRGRKIGEDGRECDFTLAAIRKPCGASEPMHRTCRESCRFQSVPIAFRIVACERQHGEAFALAFGEALHASDEGDALGRRHVGRGPIHDRKRFHVGPVLEKDATIAGPEPMQRVGRHREAKRGQPRPRERQRRDRKNEMVDRSDGSSPGRGGGGPAGAFGCLAVLTPFGAPVKKTTRRPRSLALTAVLDENAGRDRPPDSRIAMTVRKSLATLAVLFTVAQTSAQEAPLPKFGPEATPIFEATEHLREAPAPDYWTLAPFYVPQRTSSDCSLAATLMLINALSGLPENAEDELVTENTLMSTVGNQEWMIAVTEDGPGVTFAQAEAYLRESLDSFDLEGATLEAVQPDAGDAGALDRLRAALKKNEASADDIMLVYFNQGVVTGDWDGPHISPIGAYDEARDRVLIMDVDRSWYVPYWTSTETLLAALIKPVSEEHGVLAGGTGGYLLATKQ